MYPLYIWCPFTEDNLNDCRETEFRTRKNLIKYHASVSQNCFGN